MVILLMGEEEYYLALAAVIGCCTQKSSHCTDYSPGGLVEVPSLHCLGCEYPSRNQLGASSVWVILRTSSPVPHGYK